VPKFIPDLFTEEEYMELCNVSTMPKEHKCICSRSEAFISEATSQIESLTVIMSKEWIEEAESSSSITQIYRDFRILLCTIGDAKPQEAFHDPKVGVNVMSKTMADHIAPEEPLTFSHKHLKWIDGQVVESKGIFRVMSLKMGSNKVFLDFHIFDIPKGEEFILIGQPVEPLVNPNRDRATLEVKVGKEKISVSLVRSCSTITESKPEQDIVEEAMRIVQEGLTQPNIEEDAIHFTQEIDPDGKSKL
jgi:hypothetical protein